MLVTCTVAQKPVWVRLRVSTCEIQIKIQSKLNIHVRRNESNVLDNARCAKAIVQHERG